MDQEIKTYADSLYESALMDSVQALQDAQRKGTRERASRNLGVALPMSGVDIQAILAIYNEHIERSMVARFESYERAFTEAHQTPSERDFAAILDDAKQARNSAVRISLSSLEQFIKSPTLGNVASGATEATLQNNSAPAHDRVLRRWKVWKARVRLKSSTPKAEERVKQLLDQMMTLEGRHVLHHLMIKEPVEVGRTIAPGIPGERQNEQLGIAMQQGVVRHQEEGQGLRRYYWVISPQFRPVLEDLLYEEGRL